MSLPTIPHPLTHILSRETMDRLVAFESLLLQWNKRINLISRPSEPYLWERHIWDSVQLMQYIKTDQVVTDFGSGAGFPGIVLALCGVKTVHLIESDARKCAFLMEASKLAPGKIYVHNERIETLKPWTTDVITARALASLTELLRYIFPFYQDGTLCFFLKGATIDAELLDARRSWHFDSSLYPSLTHPDGAVLQLFHVEQLA